ncbi:MAG: glutaredoxin domain-containing protein [Nitrospirota bacterium]
MVDPIEDEINKEVADNKIVIYGKGTRERPMCGFTKETVEFFDRYSYPYQVVDVLQNMPKRESLSRMTNWPTLPKVFIGGQFYGDTDILDPMAANGELETLLKKVFAPASAS